jgi:antitoxin CptB
MSGRILRHCEERSDEAIQQLFLDCFATLAMTFICTYMARMPSDPELKRLAWRAHHRGTREADFLIGGFFDAHHASWREDERALFAAMLEEQDVDIMAWAHNVCDPPERFAGPMVEALKKLDYIRIAR